MNFSELILTCESLDTKFDDIMNKCKVFAEATMNEFQANLKEAELKVVQESGTPEDLIYLEDAAKEGFIVRSAKTVEKIVQAFIQWMKDKIAAVKSFFTSDKTQKTLDKAEKGVKENPKLKGKKITIPDYEKIDKEYVKLADEAKKARIDIKHGKDVSKELDEIDSNLEELNKKKKAITITVGLAAAVAMAKIVYDELVKSESDKIDSVSQADVESMEPKDVENLVHNVRTQSEIRKCQGSNLFDALHQIMSGVRSAVTGEQEITLPDLNGGKKDKDKKVEESVESTMSEETQENYINNILAEIEESAGIAEESSNEDENLTMDDLTSESTEETADAEVEAYLESVVNEIWGNEEPVSEAATEEPEKPENDNFNAEAYLESVETELFGESTEENREMTDEEYLESLEAELFPEDEPVEESASSERKQDLDAMLDDIIKSIG
jgi:hypothetical protein